MQVGEDNAWRDVGGRRWRPRTVLLAATGMLLAAGLLAHRLDRGVDGVGTSTAPPKPAPTTVAGDGARREAATPRAVEDRLRGNAPVREANPADAVPSRRRDFETTGDLFEYSQRLLPALREGDPEAAWLMSRVVDYCAVYAADPAAFARDSAALAGTGLPASEAMNAARARVDARCRRFTPADGLSQVRVRQLRLEAARGGSLAAEAELLARREPLSTASDYGNALLERIGSAGDAEAFGAMATAVDVPGWLSMLDQDVAPQYHAIVWQLAACRMGVDCGPQSTLMTSYCVNGGICSRRAGQGFEEFVYDAAVPRQSTDLVRDAVVALVDRFGGAP
ncbi:hypothetical protein [Luteimonas saliphila]|uniref:hypothetical protein n=1 Tax=Luteimonas saliphila TaxID=2804919 RepID=UPI00192D91FC|nr:hypothetical protein [Luteimonas saliphila]